MMNKSLFLSKYPAIAEGSVVYSQDGEKLGKITYMDEDSFTVEKGIFFPKDFTARYDDIVDFREGEVILNRGRTDLSDWRNESYQGWSDYDRIYGDRSSDTLMGTSSKSANDLSDRNISDMDRSNVTPIRENAASISEQDIRVPITEEKLEAQKTFRQTGEVRLRKIVHTEMKNITVPVMREEVVVERTPVIEPRTAQPGEATFQEETIRVPVMEESVEVHKRPIVKEEIHIRKEARTEQQTISGEVKSEEVKVEGEEGLRKKKVG